MVVHLPDGQTGKLRLDEITARTVRQRRATRTPRYQLRDLPCAYTRPKPYHLRRPRGPWIVGVILDVHAPIRPRIGPHAPLKVYILVALTMSPASGLMYGHYRDVWKPY